MKDMVDLTVRLESIGRGGGVSWKTKVGLWVGRPLCEINDPRKFSFQTHLNNSDFEFKLSWGGN